MPFVQRDHRKNIVGIFAHFQAGFAEEELPEGHPDVAAFRSRHPAPEGIMTALTEKELAKLSQRQRQIDKEHQDIRNAVWLFNSEFDELELSLSSLVYASLRPGLKNGSKLAYAIYFTPDGFRARLTLVNNIITQLTKERRGLAKLAPLWKSLFDQFGEVRVKRNVIAHGFPKTFQIDGRAFARLSAPAFDVLNVWRKVDDGGSFGLGSNEILQGARKAAWLRARVDEVNRLVEASCSRVPLRKRYDELEAGLRLPRN